MRAGEGKRPCQEAEAYYYDFLCQDEATVPESARRHIAACPVCQERIRRLRDTLFEAQRNSSPADTWDGKTIEELAVQFQLLDEHVTCSDVRCFLPKLAMASPQIRIPTPVTVHVDHCPQCVENLAALRELNLTAYQLRRLSWFFESGRGAGVSGSPTHDSALGGPVSPLRSPGQAKPEGRDLFAAAVQGSVSIEGAGVACDDVSTADVFDCVVPFGVPPDERHKAAAAHIRACPACRAKVQTLQRTLHGILERADSGTITVYHAQSDAEGDGDQITSPHPYPIEVQVLHGESGSAAEASDSETARTASTPGLGPAAGSPQARKRDASHWEVLAKAVVLAVALVTLPAFWWIHTPTASGRTDVGAMIKALAKVQSIRVVRTNRNAELGREYLIARRSNTLVTKTERECVVYDLDRRRRRTVEPGVGIGPPIRLSETEYYRAKDLMANCLRDILTRVSPDAKLHPSAGDLGTETVGNLDIYETTWVVPAGNSSLRNGWKVYIDPATGLPQRTELYRKRSGDTQWELLTTTVFTYPTDQEMDRSIQALFPTQ
ncbi:MAG: hypothetical protein NTZ17_04430 [Phycisphaerae bacterium]|nr:hypothetical protein [Phycisphaerae bacterium]